MLRAAIDHDIARGDEGRRCAPCFLKQHGRILATMPRAIVRLCAVLARRLREFRTISPEARTVVRDECIVSLSGFPKDVPLSPKPNYPSDLTNRPQTPKPPEQYFELSGQIRTFAKERHWL